MVCKYLILLTIYWHVIQRIGATKHVQALALPTRPLRLLVGFSQGGVADLPARWSTLLVVWGISEAP